MIINWTRWTSNKLYTLDWEKHTGTQHQISNLNIKSNYNWNKSMSNVINQMTLVKISWHLIFDSFDVVPEKKTKRKRKSKLIQFYFDIWTIISRYYTRQIYYLQIMKNKRRKMATRFCSKFIRKKFDILTNMAKTDWTHRGTKKKQTEQRMNRREITSEEAVVTKRLSDW